METYRKLPQGYSGDPSPTPYVTPSLQTLPDTLYCIGGDVKHCSIN